jgi:SAM-dependent methyltransferase
MSTYLEPDWISRFAELWERLGPETKTALLDLLPSDWSFEGKRILDFGCGAGRTLRYFMSEAETAEVWGVDIDAASVDLLRDTVCPPLHVMRSEHMPPLALDGGSFDLIWSISVFTHLTTNSIPWLLELHRLLKPDGLLIATYMGRWTSELLAGEEWDEDRIGMNVLRHNHPADDGAPLVLISDWWMREHWGRAFEVVTVAPQIHNQSWALLRKRDVEITAEEVARPGDDPREYLALHHNLVQAQREIEALQRDSKQALVSARETAREECESRITDVRRVYEDSLSWQLTRPMRAAARLGRAYARRRALGRASGGG